MTTTPKHEYETKTGTEPSAAVEHQPRTLEHKVTDPFPGGVEAQAKELYMMSEIADGVFVQWATCSKCNKRVVVCTCQGGPVEPASIASWRTTRFDKSFNERPDPSFEILPKIISWVRDRGYTVTKKSEPKPQPVETPAKDPLVVQPGQDADEVFYPGPTDDDLDFARDTLGEAATDDEVHNLADQRAERDSKELVNEGLDKVKQAITERAAIDPGF